MKKHLVTLLLIFAAVKMMPFDFAGRLSSGYNPYDHMIASAVMTYGGMELLLNAGEIFNLPFFRSRFNSFISAALLTFSLGWVKERYVDRYFSASDVNSNISGISGALLIINISDIFRRK